MALTEQDLTDIRNIVLNALDAVVNPRFDALEMRMDSLEGRMDSLEGRMDSLEGRMDSQELSQRETNRRLTTIENMLENLDGRLEALEADVKELYHMVKIAGRPSVADKRFAQLPTADKLRRLHTDILSLAKQLNVEL